jgi:hypothetical protein
MNFIKSVKLKNMKNLLITLLLLLSATFVSAQKPKVQPVNQTIIRLTIVNDTGAILMRETENGWMTLSTYYDKRQNIHEAIDSLANAFGIQISQPNLAGLFTYKYDFKPTSDIRLFYVAKYQKGELKPAKGEKLYWLPKEEALEKLGGTAESLKDMTKQILNYPEIIWGGSFILSRVDGKLMSKVEESFYPLSGNK